MLERTLLMVKPDAVRRGLIGEIVSRVEHKGFKIIGLKMVQFNQAIAEDFYREHLQKPFFPDLFAFMTSGPAAAMVLEGENVVSVTRLMMGKTKYIDAEPGTIRGDFAHNLTENVVHGSDSPESSAREIAILFKEGELYQR